MNDWTSGYVADVGYTYGYYGELNPLREKLALLAAGYDIAPCRTACELGFGQGISVNIHSASQPDTAYWATDFNSAQAGFAQLVAGASGSNVSLFDQSFEEFCRRDDLPGFDSIGLHGIWSWISDENRAVIVDFIRRKLNVGGVVYISYNTLPGWAPMVPMRHLLTEHAAIMGAHGQGIVGRIDGAISFAEKLITLNPQYSRVNPMVAERLKSIKDQNRHYLAHEYFNRDWRPMPVAEMAKWLEPAKLSFACSAHYMDHIDAVNLTPDQLTFLREIPDTLFRETVRDFMVNQQFRRDYWVRGGRKLTSLELLDILRRQRYVLAIPRENLSLKVKGALGEVEPTAAIYDPILDVFADNQPKTLGQVEQLVKEKNINIAQLREAAIILSGSGFLHPAQDDRQISKAKPFTDRLNAYLIDKSRSSNDVTYLASPVTGGGIQIARFNQMFLKAKSLGKKAPAEWAATTWQILASQGQRILKDGKTLETPQENLDELTVQANNFAQTQLPCLKALAIA
ncbi:MAG: methyltransferase regulatory domain-containing protein [Alphaproteobacteria bacterium]|nr:methyltransferase regulatory domain-containing protein [Alphaproteobacteria bacterium]